MLSRVFRLLAGALGLGMLVPLVAASPAVAEPPGSVAVALDGRFADPSFLRVGDTVHAYATGGGADGTAFPHATAPSINGPWQRAGKAMDPLPDWVGRTNDGDYQFWAPSVFENAAGDYVMYFSANNRTTNDRCVGVATATRPEGPFAPQPRPLVCGRNAVEVIDAAPVSRPDGQRFVVYKVKRRVDGRKVFEIRAHRMNDAGTAFAAEPARTLIKVRDGNLEAPDVIFNEGRAFMFVSRGSYTDCTYRTEVWSAGSLLSGTWRKNTTLMTTGGTGLCGPGGAEVRRLGEQTWMVFHAWKCPPGQSCERGNESDERRYRAMYTGRVGWGADGHSPRVLDHR